MNKTLLFFLAFVSSSASSNNEFSEFNSEVNKAQETVNRSKRLLPHNRIHLLLQEKPDLVPEEVKEIKKPVGDEAPDSASASGAAANLGANGNGHQTGGAGQQAQGSGNRDKKSDSVADEKKAADDEAAAVEAARIKKQKDAAAEAARIKKQRAEAARLKRIREAAKSRPVYTSPLLSGANSGGGSNNASVKMPQGRQIRYGITIGTKIAVELTEGASSVQPGYTSVKLLEDVAGYKSVLPAGSTVFARPKAVLGSDRLFLTASKVLDISDNSEFSISGNIRAEDGNAGLYASIVSDPRDFKRAATAGENAIVSGVIGSIANDSLVGNAAKVTADTLHDQEKQKQDFVNGQVALVVEAQPQKAFLIIEQTF